jgi:hypothetical protein
MYHPRLEQNGVLIFTELTTIKAATIGLGSQQALVSTNTKNLEQLFLNKYY